MEALPNEFVERRLTSEKSPIDVYYRNGNTKHPVTVINATATPEIRHIKIPVNSWVNEDGVNFMYSNRQYLLESFKRIK